MTTRIHSANNIYTYLENARQMENLELQIKSREEDLEAYGQLQRIYKNMGYKVMLETSVERANRVELEILRLKLEKNLVEKEMLEFELKTFLED